MGTRMRVLVAYDGGTSSNEAIEELSRAGLPAEADALVVTVAEVWVNDESSTEAAEGGAPPAHPLSERARRSLEQAEQYARKAAERLQALFPGWSIEFRVYPDSPAWGVLRAGDDWKPDMILVGSHGRSALGRLILGSVSMKVLTEATCSVRISRHHAEVAGSPVRLVVGVDGTPDSTAAVQQIARRSWPEGTAVRVIAAVEPSAMPIGVPLTYDIVTDVASDVEVLQQQHMKSAAADAVATLSGAGLLADSVLTEGSPIDLLLDEAENLGADAIFLGARGHRFMERFLLGSVSSAVAARAHCSVEVVRPAQYPPEEE